MSICLLCNDENYKVRHHRVRDKADIQVLECINCGLVYLSRLDHISDDFYEQSGMLNGKVDLDNYRKQTKKDDLRRANSLRDKLIGKRVLDFGCGSGGFLHLIKDTAGAVSGVELDKRLNHTLNSEGIECFEDISEINGAYDVITLFHVVEHLVHPIDVLSKLRKHLNPNGIILIEVPNADDALLTLYNSKEFADFTYWSCHVYLYNTETMKKMVNKAGYNVKLIKQIQRYPLSNHLHWLSSGKPGGHLHLNMLDNPMLTEAYEMALAAVGKCDTIMVEIYDSKEK